MAEDTNAVNAEAPGRSLPVPSRTAPREAPGSASWTAVILRSLSLRLNGQQLVAGRRRDLLGDIPPAELFQRVFPSCKRQQQRCTDKQEHQDATKDELMQLKGG